MQKINIVLIVLIFSISKISLLAQTENKDITITTSGSGNTLEDAKQIALRSAIEQAYGAFISSKTDVFNDQLVADQMASVSSGNIKSYEILNQDQLPNGRWGITLKTIVSIDKLTSFVESKGITVEIKGGMFALNIKQQNINELGEAEAISHMVGVLHESLQISIDYSIKCDNPKSNDLENRNWEIPMKVYAICNSNIDFCANYLIKTLTSISLTSPEIQTYESLGKNVYLINIYYKGNKTSFFMRNKKSYDLIATLSNNCDFYLRNFTIQSGFKELYGIGENEKSSFGFPDISILTAGDTVSTFSWKEQLTINQIEKLIGYKVKSRGVISFYNEKSFDERFYEFVEDMPRFPKDFDMNTFVKKNIRLLQIESNNQQPLKEILEFKVLTDGKISDINVV